MKEYECLASSVMYFKKQILKLFLSNAKSYLWFPYVVAFFKSSNRNLFNTCTMDKDKNSLVFTSLSTSLPPNIFAKTFAWSDCLPSGWVCLVVDTLIVIYFWRLKHRNLWSCTHWLWVFCVLFVFKDLIFPRAA